MRPQEDIRQILENWRLPSWWEPLNEFEMNSYVAGKLDIQPNRIGPGDIKSDSLWIECKRTLVSRGDYASLKDELDRHPTTVDSLILVYGIARKDLVEGIRRAYPKVPIIIKGNLISGQSGSGQSGERRPTIDYRSIGLQFKEYAIRNGIPELKSRNPRSTWDVLDIPVISTVRWCFGVQPTSVRVALGTSAKEDSNIKNLFRNWRAPLGNYPHRDTRGWYSWEWIKRDVGDARNIEDYQKFAMVLTELYLQAKEESKEFLKALGYGGH